jgi:hypothetical protein
VGRSDLFELLQDGVGLVQVLVHRAGHRAVVHERLQKENHTTDSLLREPDCIGKVIDMGMDDYVQVKLASQEKPPVRQTEDCASEMLRVMHTRFRRIVLPN